MRLLIALHVFLSFARLVSADLVIMPMGDSHTSGFHGTPAGVYRLELGASLDRRGISHSFVGDYFLAGNHQGVAGASIEYMTDNYGTAVANFSPDFVLLLAGTNNHWNQPVYSEFVYRYENLLNMIHYQAPNAHVIISTVPKFAYDRPNTSYWTDEFVDHRNSDVLPNMNNAIFSAASTRDWVTAVDLFSISDIESDFAPDAIHMNLYGQRKLANLFESAIVSSVPEPGSLFILGALAIFTCVRRRK